MNLTNRSKLRRTPDLGSHDWDTIKQILDAGSLAHVGFCMDGQPFVIPTLYGREGDKLYLHGEVRCGPHLDNEEDYGAPVWAGILPLEVRSRTPIPDDNLVEGVAVPEYVLRYDARLHDRVFPEAAVAAQALGGRRHRSRHSRCDEFDDPETS